MVAQVSKARPTAPVVVARSVRVTPMSAPPPGNGVTARSAAAPAATAATGSAANESGQSSTSEARDGMRAAASVMGWVLLILLALTIAAFLAFAPSML